jgi:hypothetical protein
MPAADGWYSVRDLAEILDVGCQAAYSVMISDDFPGVKAGQWRVREEDFEAWVRERYVETREYVEQLRQDDASPDMWEQRWAVNRGRPRAPGTP